MPAPSWFIDMLGWKPATSKTRSRCQRLFGGAIGPNLADLGSEASTRFAGAAFQALGIPTSRESESIDDEASRSSGRRLETSLADALRTDLHAADPGRRWHVIPGGQVGNYEQYRHLAELQQLFSDNPALRSVVGHDYVVATDVLVAVPDLALPEGRMLLHAAISSKLTIRSDRVQNVRFEFSTLIRNRKGRAPHLVLVTAEPQPSRITSIARGTGEIDAVYHLLFDELQDAIPKCIEAASDPRTEKFLVSQADDWNETVNQGRVRPYSDLAGVLASS